MLSSYGTTRFNFRAIHVPASLTILALDQRCSSDIVVKCVYGAVLEENGEKYSFDN